MMALVNICIFYSRVTGHFTFAVDDRVFVEFVLSPHDPILLSRSIDPVLVVVIAAHLACSSVARATRRRSILAERQLLVDSPRALVTAQSRSIFQ